MVWFRGRHARRWWRLKVAGIESDSSDQKQRLREAQHMRQRVENLSDEIEERDTRSAQVERSMREIYARNHLAGLFAYEVVTRNNQGN